MLDRADVDTDQIIPKQFLKRVERTGFGEFLFYDWIRDGEIELEPNPILVTGPQLRLRLLARARPLGARGLRLRGDHRARPSPTSSTSNCTKIGLLPVILDEEHCRRSPRPARRGSTSTTRRSPAPAASSSSTIEPDVKHRLLNGLDDIGITLENAGGDRRLRGVRRRRPRPGDDRAADDADARPREWDADDLRRASPSRTRSGRRRCSTGSS